MIRVKNIESLNAIREKCKSGHTDFNDAELTHLNLVFIELQKSYGKRYVRPLDRSCSSCVLRFMSSVRNYIIIEELHSEVTNEFNARPDDILNPKHVRLLDVLPEYNDNTVTISSGEVEIEQDENEKLTLPELRAKYPDVKARSKEKFLRLLNESK